MRSLYLTFLAITLLVGSSFGCTGSQATPPPSTTGAPPQTIAAPPTVIPYGTYIGNSPIFVSEIVFNSDGTYKQITSSGITEDVGYYTVTSSSVTFKSDIHNSIHQYQYRYSQQFSALYIYLIPNDDSSIVSYFRK